MINDTTLGLVSAAVPLLIIGFVILRRLPWIFAFFVALLAVGLGYLETTGTVREFGHQVRMVVPAGILPEHKKAAEAPAAEKPAAEAPAMAPATPPAEPPATAPAEPPATPAPDSTQPSSPPASPSPAPASPAP